ncbi:MAG TPA: DNA polymerase/3'-5' exonuclease PolX [Nitrospiraceae bacterium]|nr:DNA polymerase/3'-5' exonuclease PolX [Nitrospiraceae bacterium]
MNKRDIARVLEDIAFFLLLKGENPYKAKAYRNAATALLTCRQEASALVKTGTLMHVPGIGPATAAVITELVTTGTSALHHDVQGVYPSGLTELENVPGLSMKQIKRLNERAGIGSLADLQTACAGNRLLALPGFGSKVLDKLRTALGQYHRGHGYYLYANMLGEAHALATALERIQGVRAVSLAGAMRRKLEVINELLFVLMLDRTWSVAQLAARIQKLPNMTEVSCDHDTITARSPLGLPVVVKIAAPQYYGFELLHATGSAEHLDELRQRFAEQGLSDWDAVRDSFTGESVGEEEIYRAAGLPFILPELREGQGEIQWARGGALPSPLEATDVQGFFHAHTVYTDGAGTVKEMVMAARQQGYRYIGISDHSQSAFYVNGLKEDRIRAQWAEIDSIQKTYSDIRVFKGIEADILPDGTMDYPDDLLAQFDFVIASVHSRFNLPEEEQTRRICRALANPYVTMLGHPTGRLLLSRAGYRVDMAELIKTAAIHHKIIEINGSRHRLDLDWRWGRFAKSHGVKFCINPDAHAVNELSNVSLGVNVARKAGLETNDVINTRPVEDIGAMLRHSQAETP